MSFHRDMKPENVLFFHGQAVVLDFGIAKALRRTSANNDEQSGTEITQRGISLGTPMYIAPEQAAGDPGSRSPARIFTRSAS